MNVATSSPVDDLLNPGESASRPVRILAAAGRMFIEHGYEGASMEEIAKAAAVTRQTLYNRFPEGKESLFVAVAERMWKAFPVMNVATDERALQPTQQSLLTFYARTVSNPPKIPPSPEISLSTNGDTPADLELRVQHQKIAQDEPGNRNSMLPSMGGNAT